MSFSLKVKEELAGVYASARHCQLAELSALIGMCGHIYTTPSGRHYIAVSSENRGITAKCHALIRRAFGYEADVSVRYNAETKNTAYFTAVTDSDTAIKILMAAKLMDGDGSIDRDLSLVSTVGISNMCCKRAFLRGAFLAGGSMSDPEKAYHLEIVTSGPKKSEQIAKAANAFDLGAKIALRRNYYVVYIKESSQIADMLNVTGAHVSLMELENVRVLKEVRNSVNRKVNCETANLNKTVSAAVKQIEDINYIGERAGLDSLNEGLEQIARLRLRYPDMPLKDLGGLLSPAVGKSGVNHRLRRISQIADDLRQKESREEEK
ncbi:MAG: DNA-binding protein WhiA [Butyrivibrio sp.]|nr:DNA-binding protein WhiA [Butyrivibrio sp.]